MIDPCIGAATSVLHAATASSGGTDSNKNIIITA